MRAKEGKTQLLSIVPTIESKWISKNIFWSISIVMRQSYPPELAARLQAATRLLSPMQLGE